MKTYLRYFLGSLIAGIQGIASLAQVDSAGRQLPGAVKQDTLTRHQIAVFLPLYLDSAFDASATYRYDKNFPKFINPGLEFYEGAQLALDSLEKEEAPLEVQIYDTRSATQTLSQILQTAAFQKTELIIGQTGSGELQQLAAAAASLNVPFVNVNFPNDGGITNNPDFIILNSTLRTHCEGIYRFIQRNYPTKRIVLFRKKGTQEDHLQHYFMDIEKSTASVPLKIRYANLDDNFTAPSLIPYLDSNTQTVCIAGSLDENFARNFCQSLSSLNKTYSSTIIGMPTWDNIDFTGLSYSGEDILYGTPFYINPSDNLVRAIQQYFKTKFYSRPSDMVFRGYETTYRFAKMLLLYGKGLSGNIGERKYKVFNDFDIQPVLNRQTMTLDYFENKKLYFIKRTDGNFSAVY